jgi:hypothetical protein
MEAAMRGATRFVIGTLVGAALGYVVIMLVSPRPAIRGPVPAPRGDEPREQEPELEEALA